MRLKFTDVGKHAISTSVGTTSTALSQQLPQHEKVRDLQHEVEDDGLVVKQPTQPTTDIDSVCRKRDGTEPEESQV